MAQSNQDKIKRIAIYKWICPKKHQHVTKQKAIDCIERTERAAAIRAGRRPRKLAVNTERDMRMVQMRAEGQTYAEIGRKYGISRTRTRQIVTKHNRQLRWHPDRITEKWINTIGVKPPELDCD